jgi:uncharacterized protein (TIGR02246 family)
MKKDRFPLFLTGGMLFLFFAGSCDSYTNKSATKKDEASHEVVEKPDMMEVKNKIQAIANKWAAAENSRDAKVVSDFYAEDAIRLSNNMPMISGKANILKSIENELANTPKGATISIETLEVFGNEKDVIEVGKFTQKDASGKAFHHGKYLTYWQNRNGKYLAMRDMVNNDEKEK